MVEAIRKLPDTVAWALRGGYVDDAGDLVSQRSLESDSDPGDLWSWIVPRASSCASLRLGRPVFVRLARQHGLVVDFGPGRAGFCCRVVGETLEKPLAAGRTSYRKG